ncbi:MAG: hypothetical protein JSS07_05415 [Proteobacteria bacterium]|nr:hypothetical protein [Pseudomonadota bacterium]
MTKDQVVYGIKSNKIDTKLSHLEQGNIIPAFIDNNSTSHLVLTAFGAQSQSEENYSFNLNINLEGVFIPLASSNIPYESILDSWEEAFYEYILMPASDFAKYLMEQQPAQEEVDFLNVAWEKLFDIPIDPSVEGVYQVTNVYTQGFVTSLANILGFNNADFSLFLNQDDSVTSIAQNLGFQASFAEIPSILTPVIPSPGNAVPTTPNLDVTPDYLFFTFFNIPQELINGLNGIPPKTHEIYLNTYDAIEFHGNLFSSNFNGNPLGAFNVGASSTTGISAIDASLSALNIAGGSVVHTANSVILTTADGNSFELFTSGSRLGEFIYTLNNAINPTANFASLPVVDSALNFIFGPFTYVLDQFVYSVRGGNGNTSVGNIILPILDDKPVANVQGPSHAISESNIFSNTNEGSAQPDSPERIAGSLITPFESNGILIVSPDSTVVPVLPSDVGGQINPFANGSYFGANGGFVSTVSLDGVSNVAPVTSSITSTHFTLSDVLYLQAQGFTKANGYEVSSILNPVIAVQDSLGNVLLVDTVTGQYIYNLNAPFDNTSPNKSGMNDPAIAHFDYTLTDRQGQTASAQLNITINDDAPLVQSSSGSVYEAGLPNGSGTGDTTLVVKGDLGVFGADGRDLTTPIIISLATTGATHTATGELNSGILTTKSTTIGSDPAISVTDSLNGNTLLINLKTLEYTYTLSDPILFTDSQAVQTYSLTFLDGDGSTAQANIVVTILNDPPVLANAGSTVTYVTDGSAVVIENAITLSDPFPTLGNNGTDAVIVSITNGFFEGDQLNFTNQNGIVGNYNANTGELILSGIASVLDYQAALRTITYSSTSDNPANEGTNFTRTITWQAFDSANDGSNTATSTISIIGLPPVLGDAGDSVRYVALSNPLLIESNISITSIDYPILKGATISISQGFFAGDVLSFNNQNGISGSYAAGVLTLTGSASVVDYMAAFHSITYSSSSADPTNNGANLFRDITWIADDGQVTNNLSNAVLSIIEVRTLPDINADSTITYVANSVAQVIDSGLTLTVHESPTIIGAVVTITSGFDADDVLSFVNTATITGVYDAGTGILTLSGTDTADNYETALQSIKYSSSSTDPTNGGADLSRTISWLVTDDLSENSNTAISTIEVRTPPTVNAGSTITYLALDPPQLIESGLTLLSIATSTIKSATVTISAGLDMDDFLTFTATATITGNYDSNTGILSLIGPDTVEHYEAALQSVTYESNSVDPTLGGTDLHRTISWQIIDSLDQSSAVATSTIDVFTPPTITAGNTITYLAGDAGEVIDNKLNVTELQSPTIKSAVISIISGFDNEDVLSFTNTPNITGSYNSGTGVLTLTGNDTPENYETALQSIAFHSSSTDPTNGGTDLHRTISWQVTDGLDKSNTAATSTIDVFTPPTLEAANFFFKYQSGANPSKLNGSVIITDHETSNMASATVSITDGFLFGDQLHFNNQNGITGNYDANNGILSLSGTSSIANYNAALSSVTYSFTGSDPTDNGNDPNRTFSWQATDSLSQTTNVDTSTILVTFTPVVLDLDDNGIQLISAHQSNVTLGNVTGTSDSQLLGWIAEGDGILMLNSNGNGTITNANQISFTSYVSGAKTDLQGLAAFDTNHDGQLDAQDKAYSEFGILHSNLKFETLSQLNIVSISLTSDNHLQTMNGNTIYGMTSYQTTDGKSHLAADVGLMIGANSVASTLSTQDVITNKTQIDFTPLASQAPASSTTPVSPTHTVDNATSTVGEMNASVVSATTEHLMQPQHEQPV